VTKIYDFILLHPLKKLNHPEKIVAKTLFPIPTISKQCDFKKAKVECEIQFWKHISFWSAWLKMKLRVSV
jgi:hypothetical protein